MQNGVLASCNYNLLGVICKIWNGRQCLRKLHRQDVNLNHTLKDGHIFKISSESRDSPWAQRRYQETSFWLQVEHRVQDKRERLEEEVTHASQTLTYTGISTSWTCCSWLSVGKGSKTLHFSPPPGCADAAGPWTPQPLDRETQMSHPSAESGMQKQDWQGRAGGQQFCQRVYSNAETGQTDNSISDTKW